MNWESAVNTIRGKNLVGLTTKEDVDLLFQYMDKIEFGLERLAGEGDEKALCVIKGDWREYCGVA
ncbi:MAG: hypothetical protein WC315_00215 [Candidatus Omnitrophota bacterium]|jgi:hypothetical protein